MRSNHLSYRPLHFRPLLERHRLTEQLFALARGILEEKRLLLKAGTIVDATIINAPPRPRMPRGAATPRGTRGGRAPPGTSG